MRPVIMWNLMTLDGCFEGTEPWDLAFHEDGWSDDLAKFANAQLATADALLFGRNTYEGMARHWPTAKGAIADGMNAIEKVVFSSTLQSADWNNTRLVRGDPAREVARLRREDGGTLLLFGSATLSAALIPAGLIDEYRICIVPGLLGAGRPLFPRDDPRVKTKLRLLDSWTTDRGCIVAHYAPLTPTR